MGRVVLWNVLLLVVGMAAVAGIGEAYLRLTWPFARPALEFEYMSGVGYLLKPHSEVRWTNWLDYWTTSRANSLGFLDREPPTPQRTRSSCHVAVVGDSYVEAKEVRIADKVQVWLERMAAQQLPQLDVTTAAYGWRGTGQLQQLAFWDEWIRHRPSRLVVLVFAYNDFSDNAETRPDVATAERTEHGTTLVLPPDKPSLAPTRGWRRWLPGERPWEVHPPILGAWSMLWLGRKRAAWRRLAPPPPAPNRVPPLLSADGLELTGFALDQWTERTRQAGSELVVMSSHSMSRPLRFALSKLAADRRIPLVDQVDYIRRQGGSLADAHFPNDEHWSPLGHQWAAEALVEWLAENRWVCDGQPVDPGTAPG